MSSLLERRGRFDGRRAGRVAAATAVLLLALAAEPVCAAELAGVPALPTRMADVVATMDVDPAGRLVKRIIIAESTRTGRRLRAYAVDMTKRIHLIVVSDDLREFNHVHPVLDAAGSFRATVAVPRPGLYHLYADTEPQGYGHRVFRFDVRFGTGATGHRPTAPRPARRIVHAGPYAVALDRTVLSAGTANALAVTITRRGRPATDLHPYLGGLAHAVFVNAADLSYVHVHPVAPGAMHGMSGMHPNDTSGSARTMGDAMAMETLTPDAHVAPHMTLGVLLPSSGTYVLWLQFRGGTQLHVARFIVSARRR